MSRLFPVAALLWAQAFARPTLPQLPLGTASASFAGGGAAHASGVGSIFANPAALSVRDAFQAEAGLMGLSSGLSPYLLFGAPAGEQGSYALGYWYDARPGNPDSAYAPRQGLAMAASWEGFPWATAGALIKATGTGEGVGRDGFGIDADLGAMLRAWRAAWLGLVLHDAMESGVGQEPEGFRMHRSYVVSVGAGQAAFRFSGLAFHEPEAEYELRSQGLPPYARVAHAFSVGSAFFPGGRLGFRATVDLPQGGAPGFAWGTFLNLPLGDGLVAVAYAFHAGGSPETGEAGASHSLSVNFRMGGRLDPLPPTVEVSADKPSLAADDSAGLLFRLAAHDLTYIHGQSESPDAGGGEGDWGGRRPSLDAGRSLAEGRIRAWTLSIRALGDKGLAGPCVRRFQGRDLPPRAIRWQAEDDTGRKLPAGFYAYRLEAEDEAGNAAATEWQLVRIGAAPAGPGPAASPAQPEPPAGPGGPSDAWPGSAADPGIPPETPPIGPGR